MAPPCTHPQKPAAGDSGGKKYDDLAFFLHKFEFQRNNITIFCFFESPHVRMHASFLGFHGRFLVLMFMTISHQRPIFTRRPMSSLAFAQLWFLGHSTRHHADHNIIFTARQKLEIKSGFLAHYQ
jgi:hypothetical protein